MNKESYKLNLKDSQKVPMLMWVFKAAIINASMSNKEYAWHKIKKN